MHDMLAEYEQNTDNKNIKVTTTLQENIKMCYAPVK